MSKDTELILLSTLLGNGLHVTIYDECKRIAWDRYFVKISCVTKAQYTDKECENLLTSQEFKAFKEKYPDCVLTYQTEKERNFIDEGVKNDVLQDLVTQCEINFDYMATSRFAENLLSKTVEEFIQEFKVRQEMGLVQNTDDIDEPDDFSACFK